MATTTTAPKLKTHVGERIRRTEDPRLITGTACYLDDITRPGMLHAAVLRSPYAAARINSISIEDALALPGVKAVYVGKDVESVGGVPCAGSMPDLRIPDHKILAGDRVYYVGHPVAAVVATDKYIAADAIERIEVDYEPTELVSDPEEALQEGAVKVHPEYPDNVAFTFSQEGGDVEEAFRQADVIVKEKILVPRLAPLPIETRGVVAEYDEGSQELTIYSSTQIPHLLRTQLALQLNLPEHHVRVIAPEVGGGFGSKCNVWAEEALAAFVAMELKQPVKWVESRRESILVVAHGRAHVDTLELAAKNDGTLLGLKLHILCDIGAHHQLLTPIIPTLAVLMLPGLYKFRSFKADLIGAFTNRAPSDLYRGAGRPEATYVIERMVDKLAAEIGMDPAEIRFKNFPASTDFPFNSATGLQYDSGDYATAFNKALDIVDYKARRAEQEAARAEGRLYGIGISTYGEICAFGPSPATPAGGWESASVNVEATGKVAVMTGISPHGQGEETSFAQLTADALGIPMDDIVVVHGDTAKVHYGIGTFGSRGISIGGSALHLALQDVVAKATKYAAHMMGVDAETVTFEGGVFSSESDGFYADLGGRRPRGPSVPAVAAGDRAWPGCDPILRTIELCVPVRGAYLRDRSGQGDRRGRYSTIRRSGRLRQDHQPVAGRGPDSRRHRPGFGSGLPRGGDLRRRRSAPQRHSDGLLHPQGEEYALDRDRPHRDAVSGQPAGYEGRRRGGHDRLAARIRELRRRRPLAARHRAYRHPDDIPIDLERHP